MLDIKGKATGEWPTECWINIRRVWVCSLVPQTLSSHPLKPFPSSSLQQIVSVNMFLSLLTYMAALQYLLGHSPVMYNDCWHKRLWFEDSNLVSDTTTAHPVSFQGSPKAQSETSWGTLGFFKAALMNQVHYVTIYLSFNQAWIYGYSWLRTSTQSNNCYLFPSGGK